MNNTKAFTRITNSIAPYFEGEKELLERVLFAKTVIRNTLQKFDYAHRPSQLMWAYASPAHSHITGFTFQNKGSKGNVRTPVTPENPLTGQYVLRFYVITRRVTDLKLSTEEVALPATLLFKDPMAIAQYARKLIRAQQAGDRKTAAIEATQKLRELDKKLAEADRTRQNLEREKEKVTAKREEYRAAAKNHEEGWEARRQEKIARRKARREEAKK